MNRLFGAWRPAVIMSALTLAVALSACQGEEDAGGELPMLAEQNEAVPIRCPDGLLFEAFFAEESALIVFADTALSLSQVPTDSGARYVGDGFELHVSGNDAAWTTPDNSFRNCVVHESLDSVWQNAFERGVDFRAIGQEPGWMLEVFGNRRMVFEAEYGAERYVFTEPNLWSERTETTAEYRGTSDDHEIRVEVRTEPCEDIMSGERLAASVTVHFDDRTFEGCGRALP